jgi:hypothetical protein
MNRREFLAIIGGATAAAALGIPPEDPLRLGFVTYEEVGMIVHHPDLVMISEFEVASRPKIPYAAMVAAVRRWDEEEQTPVD